MAPQMYVARESFYAVVNGERTMIHGGIDLVAAGHPILKRYPGMFVPAPVRFDVEQATAAPGERRGAPQADAPAPPPVTKEPGYMMDEPAVKRPARKGRGGRTP
jgi:hypothetical protein